MTRTKDAIRRRAERQFKERAKWVYARMVKR